MRLGQSDLDHKRRVEEIRLKQNEERLLEKYALKLKSSESTIPRPIDVRENKSSNVVFRSVGIDPGMDNFAIAIWHCEEKTAPHLIFCNKYQIRNFFPRYAVSVLEDYATNLTPSEFIKRFLEANPSLYNAFCDKSESELPAADYLHIAVEQFPDHAQLKWLTKYIVDGLKEFLNLNSEFFPEIYVKHSSGFLLHSTRGPLAVLPKTTEKLNMNLYVRRPLYAEEFDDDEAIKRRNADRRFRKATTGKLAKCLLTGNLSAPYELTVDDSIIKQYRGMPLNKADDYGDALLHGLYRPLVPYQGLNPYHVMSKGRQMVKDSIATTRLVTVSPGCSKTLITVVTWTLPTHVQVNLFKWIETPYRSFGSSGESIAISTTAQERSKLWHNECGKLFENLLDHSEINDSEITDLPKCKYIFVAIKNLHQYDPYQRFMIKDIRSFVRDLSKKPNITIKNFNNIRSMWQTRSDIHDTSYGGLDHECWDTFTELRDLVQDGIYDTTEYKVEKIVNTVINAEEPLENFTLARSALDFWDIHLPTWILSKRALESIILPIYEIKKMVTSKLITT